MNGRGAAGVVLVATLLLAGRVLAAAAAADFVLAAECPAGFEKTGGVCRLHSAYQRYDSPPGFGGLRVPLPPLRDGYTPAQIDLGRYLFFDPLLSAEADVSCAHCHHPDYGYADGRARAIGRGGRGVGPDRHGGAQLARASPSLWNVGFLSHLFWDGRADSLEAQAQGPLFAANEMGTTPQRLEASLNASPVYRRLFQQAFAIDPAGRIEVRHVAAALTAFQSTLVSLDSRYDRYAHGDPSALTGQEIEGMNVFRSFVARCSQCHTPPLFTNGELAVIGTPEPPGKALDPGAGETLGEASLRGAFKVPTLRNVALTAPYMHSGAFATLAQVVKFYNGGRAHALPPGERLMIHWHITSPDLRAPELDALVAFLGTLTDESGAPAVPDRVPSGLPVVPVRGPGEHAPGDGSQKE
ncbi:MAG: cytochrome-c peroxidase [Gammaproteobacteria bacterium]|nr:cytochrome-c peroxidase [Gammaproteobacteria bacterium]